MKTLKKGDTVQIYGKPLTNEMPEGEAKLMSKTRNQFVNQHHPELENWKVKFVSDGFVTERLVSLC